MTDSLSDPVSVPSAVADRVRTLLARKSISARQAAFQLGWKQPYMSRRMTGEVPWDVADLAKLAALLKVEIVDFLPNRRRTGKGGIIKSTSPRWALAS